MSFLKKLGNIFSGNSEPPVYWVYVCYERCNEAVAARIDMRGNLSEQDDDTYFCRKVLVGSKRCFQPIEVELTFDKSKNLIDQQITGGKFITAEEYEATQTD